MIEFEEDKIYIIGNNFKFLSIIIIGGLVDHNRLKNTTYEWASQNKIATRRLPIKKYIEIHQSHVLIINHVFEILLNKYNGKDWERSLLDSIPLRKLKNNENNNENQTEQKDKLEDSKLQ